MGSADDDATALRKRAGTLRDCAKDARAIARTLGPYLDDAVRKAAPRAADLTGAGGGGAIWLGPFADQCTATLQQRKQRLGGMANSLMADAGRWETEASELERQATAKDKAKAKADAGKGSG